MSATVKASYDTASLVLITGDNEVTTSAPPWTTAACNWEVCMGQQEQRVLTGADIPVPVPVFVLRKFRHSAWEVTGFMSNILQKRKKSSLLESTPGIYPDS